MKKRLFSILITCAILGIAIPVTADVVFHVTTISDPFSKVTSKQNNNQYFSVIADAGSFNYDAAWLICTSHGVSNYAESDGAWVNSMNLSDNAQYIAGNAYYGATFEMFSTSYDAAYLSASGTYIP